MAADYAAAVAGCYAAAPVDAAAEPVDFLYSNGTSKQYADWRDLPSETLDKEELRTAVRETVAKLPEKYRVIFLLADAQSLSYEEIASTLQISVANVKTRLHRARMKLQEQLTPAFKPRISDHWGMLKGMNPWSRARK